MKQRKGEYNFQSVGLTDLTFLDQALHIFNSLYNRISFQKTAELKAYDGIATGVEKVVKSDAGATKAVALTSEGAINSAAEAISEYSGYCDIVAMMFPNQFQVAASYYFDNAK